jgi:hypothetical protein
MIQPLRAWHRRVWLLWAILLPLLFIAGLLSRPPQSDSPPVEAHTTNGGRQ